MAKKATEQNEKKKQTEAKETKEVKKSDTKKQPPQKNTSDAKAKSIGDDTKIAENAATEESLDTFAIVKKGQHQFFLVPGQKLDLPRMNITEGKEYTFNDVLALYKDGEFLLGTPTVEGAYAKVFVIKHVRGPKKYGFKYKAKSRYRRKWGYRNLYTRVRVLEVGIKK